MRMRIVQEKYHVTLLLSRVLVDKGGNNACAFGWPGKLGLLRVALARWAGFNLGSRQMTREAQAKTRKPPLPDRKR